MELDSSYQHGNCAPTSGCPVVDGHYHARLQERYHAQTEDRCICPVGSVGTVSPGVESGRVNSRDGWSIVVPGHAGRPDSAADYPTTTLI